VFFYKKELCWINQLLPAGKKPNVAQPNHQPNGTQRSYGTCRGHRAEVVILGRRFTPTLIGGREAALKSCSLRKHFLKENNQPEMVMTLSWSTDLIRCWFLFGVSLWLVGSELWIFYQSSSFPNSRLKSVAVMSKTPLSQQSVADPKRFSMRLDSVDSESST